MRRRYPRLLPTLITIAIVLTCSGLGVWQLERLQWKRALIAVRQAAVAAPPLAPPHTLEEARGMEFRHVTDEGFFLNDSELYLGATSPHDGAAGFDVFTPWRETDGRIVFVNRGFVPNERKDPATRRAGQPDGTVRISGLLRVPHENKPSWFLPHNRPDLNYWFWVD